MLEALGQAVAFLFQPASLLMILIAVIVGLIIGIIPGIGGLIGIVLFLPLVFKMSPEVALTSLVAFHAVVFTGGALTAILINVPGTGPNAATLLDGFPMNQKGEGSRAIGAATMASTVGGIAPVFMALVMIPLILPIVMAFRSPEMAMMVLVGLSFLAVLTGRSVVKGLIAACAGVILSLVGFHGVTGVDRFSYGSMFLYDGFKIVPVVLGLFGISEMLRLLVKGQSTIAGEKAQKGNLAQVWQGCKDVWTHRWLWFRSTIIGYIVGIIPGIGAEVSTFVAYGQAKQLSKHPELFGTGCVEGVIAPEAAANSKEAGSLLTTMAFGIPGSAVMAVMMGGFLLVGVTPGPSMLVDHLPLALTLLVGIAISNIMGGAICIFTGPYISRIAFLNINSLFPIIVVLLIAGAYIASDSILALAVTIVFGIIGYLMVIYDYARPSLLLGFVLGHLFENYTLLSIKAFGPTFFLSPICLVLIGIVVLTFLFPWLKKVFTRRGKAYEQT